MACTFSNLWTYSTKSLCGLKEFWIQASVSCPIKLIKQEIGDISFSLRHGWILLKKLILSSQQNLKKGVTLSPAPGGVTFKCLTNRWCGIMKHRAHGSMVFMECECVHARTHARIHRLFVESPLSPCFHVNRMICFHNTGPSSGIHVYDDLGKFLFCTVTWQLKATTVEQIDETTA
jgi:hypothetical protein